MTFVSEVLVSMAALSYSFFCGVRLCLCGMGLLMGLLSVPHDIQVNMEQCWNDIAREKPST
jgi:hypothetical protein